MCVGPNKNKNHMVFVVIFIFVFSSSSLSVTLCCCCVSLSCLEFLKNLFFFSSWLSEWRAVATPILALVFPLPQQQIWLLFFSSYYKNEILSSTILRIECPFFFFSIALLLHSLTVMLSLTLPTLSLSLRLILRIVRIQHSWLPTLGSVAETFVVAALLIFNESNTEWVCVQWWWVYRLLSRSRGFALHLLRWRRVYKPPLSEQSQSFEFVFSSATFSSSKTAFVLYYYCTPKNKQKEKLFGLTKKINKICSKGFDKYQTKNTKLQYELFLTLATQTRDLHFS